MYESTNVIIMNKQIATNDNFPFYDVIFPTKERVPAPDKFNTESVSSQTQYLSSVFALNISGTGTPR